MRLEPAILTFDSAGTPFSSVYGDVYHSAESGPGQARHVFLGGNDLPSGWAGKHVFTIVETGFGLGLNFLATWQAWRADTVRPARLHFVSIEKHPFARDALSAAHERYPEFASLAVQLQAAWPPLVPGLHRLHFEDGRVTLTLVFADAADALFRPPLGADAFYLDGFAPRRNADMWTPRLMKALARLARPGATLATYTTARPVRDALAEAGFVVARRPGFGRKRDMLAARYTPRWQPRQMPPVAPEWPQRHAIVIGAGLAGAAVSERLAAREWRIDLIERNIAPAAETSNLHAGVFQPQLSRDDGIPSRLARAGFLYGIERWRALEAAGHALIWERCGVLRIAQNGADEARMAQTIAALGYAPAYAQYADHATACLRAGCEVSAGGWWFPQGGWMKPISLVAAQLAAARVRYIDAPRLAVHYGKGVHELKRDGEYWQALAADGSVIAAAPVVVLANANDAARLADPGQPLRRVRGQLTYLPAGVAPALRAVVTGGGFLLPAVDGIAVSGASYDFDDDDPMPRVAGHAGNLERLAHLVNAAITDIDPALLNGSVGFRCVAPDRMPLIGALPDLAQARAQSGDLLGAHAADLPRLEGLYGAFGYASRGLVWAGLGGELIASLIEGEPLPLETDLIDAVDPGRFVLKLVRRGEL